MYSLAVRCTVVNMDAHRNPGQRAGLTSETVLTAAREVLAARGLPGLTMRALADHLGVAPNALYSHVESKTALIDAVLDDVLGEIAVPPAGGEPIDGLHDLMVSTYEVLLAQPDLVPGYLARQGARGVNARRLGDVMLELLASAGITGARADEALMVLIVHAIGFAAFATSAEPGATDRPRSADQSLETFTTGLHWLLTGITSQR